jgi:transposase
MAKRRKWSATQKFEIALQAVRGEKTLNEICKRYMVSPTQVNEWKKQLLEQGSQLFAKSSRSTKEADDTENTQRLLYEKIGQLTVERDFLKKVWGKYQESKDET